MAPETNEAVDIFGRALGASKEELSKALIDTIESTKHETETKKETNELIKELNKQFEKLYESINDEKDVIEKLIDKIKDLKKTPKGSDSEKVIKNAFDNLSKIIGSSSGGGQFTKIEDSLNKALLGIKNAKLRSGGGVSGTIDVSADESIKASNALIEAASNTEIINQNMEKAKDHTIAWSSALSFASNTLISLTGGLDVFRTIFKGAIKDELKFSREIRAIAFQTEGITSSSKEMQKDFVKIGKTVAQTGKSLTTFQNTLIKNLKAGIKDREATISLTKTSLNLSTMIGANHESINESLKTIYQTTGMTTNEMSDLSRGIQDVAKWTGVTGDNLANAVQTSQEFIKSMRNAGTLTSEAAKNLISMSASAAKYGVEISNSKITQALSSTNKLLFDADEKTQALIFTSARIGGVLDEAMNGTLLKSKSSIKKFTQGMESQFNRLAANAGTSMQEVIDGTASPEALRNLNLTMNATFGLESGEFIKQLDVMKESGMTVADRIKDINSQMQNVNLTTAEQLKLEQDRKKLITNATLGFLTEFDKKAGKSGTTLESAFSKISDEMKNDLSSAGITVGSASETLQNAAMAAANNIKEAGGADLTAKVKSAFEGGDITKVRELMTQLNSEQQKAGVAQAKSLDPMTKSVHELEKLNESFRSFSGPALTGLLDIVGSLGLISASLVASVAGAVAGGAIGGLGKGLLGKIGGMLGGGKKAAGGGMMGGGGGGMMGGGGGGMMGGGGGGMMGGMGDFAKNINVKSLAAVGGKLALGAAAIAVVTVGLVALASAVLKTSSVILGMTGMDEKEMLKISLVIGAILGGFIILYLAMEKGAKLIEKTDPKIIFKAIPKIAIGAAALVILVPTIALLGAAIIGFTAGIMALMGIPDATTVMNMSMTVGAMILGVGIISLAIIGASASLAILGLLAGQASVLAPLMGMGAIAFLILTPVLALLGAAVICLTNMILGALSMDLASIMNATLAVSLMMIGVALISSAILSASLVLSVLGVLAPVAGVIAGLMVLGTSAIMLLSVPLVLLASAIFYLTDMIMGVVPDPKKASETASSIGSLIMSAAKIAAGIAMAAAGLSALGAMAMYAWILIPAMVAGSVVLLALTPAVLGFVKVLVVLTSSVLKALGGAKFIEEASQTAKALGELLESSGNIASSIQNNALYLASYGTLLPLLPNILTWMAIGQFVLASLATSIAASVKMILMFASLIINQSFNAEEINEGLKNVMQAFDTINQMIMEMGEKFTKLTTPGWISDSPLTQFSKALFPLALQMPYITMVLSFILSSIMPLTEFDMDELCETLLGVADLFKHLSYTLQTMSEEILPLVQKQNSSIGTLFGLFEGKSEMEKLADPKMIKSFSDNFFSIGIFIKYGIVKPIESLFGEVDLEKSASTLSSLATIISSVIPILDGMKNSIAPLATPGYIFGSEISNLAGVTEEFKENFEKIAEFIKTGIVDPVTNKFDNTGLEAAAKTLKYLAVIINSTVPILDGMKNSIVPLATSGFIYGSEISNLANEKVQKEFKDNFEKIANFINTSIVEPVTTQFKDIKKLKTAAEILGAIERIMIALVPSLNAVKAVLDKFGKKENLIWENPSEISELASKTDDFKEGFGTLAKFISEGIVKPIKDMDYAQVKMASQIMSVIAPILDGVKTSLNNIQSIIEQKSTVRKLTMKLNKMGPSLYELFNSINTNILKPISEIPIENGEKAATKMSGAVKVLSIIPEFVKRIKNNLEGIQKSGILEDMSFVGIIEGMGDSFVRLFSGLNTNLLQPISQMLEDTVLDDAVAKIQQLSDMFDKLANASANLSKFAGVDINASASTTQTAIHSYKNPEDDIVKERAGGLDSKSKGGEQSDLSNIESSTSETVIELRKMNNLLTSILNKSGESSGPPRGRTKSDIRNQQSPADVGTWSYNIAESLGFKDLTQT